MPDSSGRKLVRFITAAEGNLALAAEKAGMSQQDLIAAIVGDNEGSTLTEQLRALLIVNAFDTLMMTSIAFKASLDDLDPEDLAKAYSSQMSTLNAMLKTPAVELSDEAPYDATMAKQRILTRISQYRKREEAELEEVEVSDEAV